MSITCAMPADIPALTKLVNKGYRGTGGWTSETHLIEGARTDEQSIQELMDDPEAMVLKNTDQDEILTGCVYLKKVGNILHLGMLSVSPDVQAKGIGKDLLGAALAYAQEKECTAIRITVISARTELIAWYERQGYVRTGEVEPFHAGKKFGIQKEPLELVVLKKPVDQ